MRCASVFGICAALAAPLYAEEAAIERPTYRVGDAWAYVRTDKLLNNAGKQIRYTDTIIAMTEGRIEVRPVGANGAQGEKRAYTPEFNLLERGALKFEPAVAGLSFPLAVGKTWRGHHEFEVPTGWGRMRVDTRSTVEGWETVTVPAGTFRALKIVTLYANHLTTHGRTLGGDGTWSYWWSPGVRGVVRREEQTFWVANPETHFVWELLAFRAGQ